MLIFFSIGFLHREIHSFYKYVRNEFHIYYLSTMDLYTTHMYPVKEWAAERSSNDEKIIILSKLHWFVPHQRCDTEKENTFQFIQLLIFRRIIIFLSTDHSKELNFRIFLRQFYLNNMQYHQITYNFPPRKKYNIKTLILFLFLEFIFI